jgi:hypothetical protein
VFTRYACNDHLQPAQRHATLIATKTATGAKTIETIFSTVAAFQLPFETYPAHLP